MSVRRACGDRVPWAEHSQLAFEKQHCHIIARVSVLNATNGDGKGKATRSSNSTSSSHRSSS